MHTIINTKQTNIRVNIENIHAHDDESYDQNQKRMVQMPLPNTNITSF